MKLNLIVLESTHAFLRLEINHHVSNSSMVHIVYLPTPDVRGRFSVFERNICLPRIKVGLAQIKVKTRGELQLTQIKFLSKMRYLRHVADPSHEAPCIET